jgi:hypothetical protein
MYHIYHAPGSKWSTYPGCKCCSILWRIYQPIWCRITRTPSTHHSHIHWQIFQDGHHLDVIHAQQTMPIHLCNSNINLSHRNDRIKVQNDQLKFMLFILLMQVLWLHDHAIYKQMINNTKKSGKILSGCGNGGRLSTFVMCSSTPATNVRSICSTGRIVTSESHTTYFTTKHRRL